MKIHNYIIIRKGYNVDLPGRTTTSQWAQRLSITIIVSNCNMQQDNHAGYLRGPSTINIFNAFQILRLQQFYTSHMLGITSSKTNCLEKREKFLIAEKLKFCSWTNRIIMLTYECNVHIICIRLPVSVCSERFSIRWMFLLVVALYCFCAAFVTAK